MEDNKRTETPQQEFKEYGGCLSALLPLWIFTSILILAYNIFILCTSVGNPECMAVLSGLIISNIVGIAGLVLLMKFNVTGFYLVLACKIIEIIIAGAWPQYMLQEDAVMRAVFETVFICILLGIKNKTTGKNGYQTIGLTTPSEEDLLPKKTDSTIAETTLEANPIMEDNDVPPVVTEEEPITTEHANIIAEQPTKEDPKIVIDAAPIRIEDNKVDVVETKPEPVQVKPVAQSITEKVENTSETIKTEKQESVKYSYKLSSLDIALLIYSVLLCICLCSMPYGYYTLIRYIGTVIFICVAYEAFIAKNKPLLVIGLSIAFLFQPFYKIDLGRDVWNAVDVILAIIIVISVIMRVFKTKHRKNRES